MIPMRILFLNEINKYDSVGIELLSSLAKENGFDSRVFLVPDLIHNTTLTLKSLEYLKPLFHLKDEDIVTHLLAFKPAVVCFSIATDYFRRSLTLAAMLRSRDRDLITIAGGPHATVATDYVLEHDEFDYVCKGEGEIALTRLLNCLKQKNYSPEIPGIYYRNGKEICGSGVGEVVENLDDLPFLDKKDVYMDYPFYERLYTINTLRSCPFSCTYCGSPDFRNIYKQRGINVVRRRSVDSTVKELAAAKKKYRKMKRVGFFDDAFTYKTEWVKDFSREYKKHVNLPFFMCTNPVLLKDEDIVIDLKSAGLIYVEIGVQAIDEQYRMKTVKRPDKDEHIFQCARLLRKHDIYFQVNHIFGLDKRDLYDEEFLKRTVEYYLKLRPNRTHCFELQYLPGSKIMKDDLANGNLTKDDYDRIFRGGSPCHYNFGGSIKDYKKFTPYVVLLELMPFVPLKFIKLCMRKRVLFKLIKLIPYSYVILARLLNTIKDKRDVEGSPHYRKYIDGSLFVIKMKRRLRKFNIKENIIGL